MTNEEVISYLEMDNALMTFDPMTGKDVPIENQNELNREAYQANLEAIEIIKENEQLKAEIEHLKEELKSSVELPYKVGDSVTARIIMPHNGHGIIMNGTVTDIQTVIRVKNELDTYVDFYASNLGINVFLTSNGKDLRRPLCRSSIMQFLRIGMMKLLFQKKNTQKEK